MIEWSKTAFVFPGQGSQELGMGADLVSAYPAAEAIFTQADEILGFPLSTLCFEGPEDALTDTLNTQPALYVMGVAVLHILAAHGLPQPAYVAGHSLGEFTALTAAGALNFADGVRLVRERGRLMKQAGKDTPGSMAAILGLSADVVRTLCAEISEQTGKPLVLANDNCEGQLVISGDKEAIEAALPAASERGAKRVVPLAVSIAAHSPLMGPISADFRRALDNTPFTAPALPIIGNVQAAPLQTVDEIRAELSAQLTSTVRWTESVQTMLDNGVTTFVELGPKDVLSGLIKRIDRSTTRITLNNAASVNNFLAAQKP